MRNNFITKDYIKILQDPSCLARKVEYHGELVLKAMTDDLSMFREVEDIQTYVGTFDRRHAAIIKVRRVSVARLNRAAPRMIDAPRAAYFRYINAYFH